MIGKTAIKIHGGDAKPEHKKGDQSKGVGIAPGNERLPPGGRERSTTEVEIPCTVLAGRKGGAEF